MYFAWARFLVIIIELRLNLETRGLKIALMTNLESGTQFTKVWFTYLFSPQFHQFQNWRCWNLSCSCYIVNTGWSDYWESNLIPFSWHHLWEGDSSDEEELLANGKFFNEKFLVDVICDIFSIYVNNVQMDKSIFPFQNILRAINPFMYKKITS